MKGVKWRTKTMKLSNKDKELIAKWFKSQEDAVPDADGYISNYSIPEDIMGVYEKLYPNWWDTEERSIRLWRVALLVVGMILFIVGMSWLISLI